MGRSLISENAGQIIGEGQIAHQWMGFSDECRSCLMGDHHQCRAHIYRRVNKRVVFLLQQRKELRVLLSSSTAQADQVRRARWNGGNGGPESLLVTGGAIAVGSGRGKGLVQFK